MIRSEIKQDGFALLAIALAVVLIATVAFGSSFFWSPGSGSKTNLAEINKDTDELKAINNARIKEIGSVLDDKQSTSTNQ